MNWKIDTADVIDWAGKYEGPRFHALLCDPPYHMGEKGFMGQAWDGGDIAFRSKTWEAFAKVLYPGAFGMAFASARRWHRMAVAIEDAGFIIHPSIFLWAYGSGFPKATRVKDDRFNGHRYGLQAMKPAGEPIIVFNKPDICYNESSDIATDIACMLEDLWRRFAVSAEAITRAESIVTTALSNVETRTGSKEEHIIVKDAEKNLLGGSRKLKKGAVPIAPDNVKTEKLGNGLTAQTAINRSINGNQQSNPTERNSCIAADHVIPNIEYDSGSEIANNADSDTQHQDPIGIPDIAQVSADTNQKNGQCSKTHLEMGIDTDTVAAILRFNSERARFDLSMIWLWKITWADVCDRANRSTIEMRSRTITDLRTLSFSLRKLMLASRGMESKKNSLGSLLSYASDVNARFASLSTCLKELSPSAINAPKTQPIIVFQKPYEGRPIDDIVGTGAGTLNIDAGRIQSGEDYRLKCASVVGLDRGGDQGRVYSPMGGVRPDSTSDKGRWPSNLILLDDDAAQAIDIQSGELSMGTIRKAKGIRQGGFAQPGAENGQGLPNGDIHVDAGGASRFFFQVQDQIDEADPVYYCAKPERGQRDEGLDDIETTTRNRVNAGGLENDPRWKPVKAKNTHPTVKPVRLTRYLAGLLLPPSNYARRLLVPFSGSGSEMIGAELAGWDWIQGIDKDPKYIEIAKARMDHWRRKSVGDLFQEIADAETQSKLFE